VNREHLKAFLWLRWRLRVNQMRKAGVVNAAIFAVFEVMCLALSAILFVLGLVLGALPFGDAPAYVHLFTWDGIVLAFLFSWMIGMLADL
jgi:ABC-2 type transport system permease protein